MSEWKLIAELACQECEGKKTITKTEGRFITTMTCSGCKGRGISHKLYMGIPYRDKNDIVKKTGP